MAAIWRITKKTSATISGSLKISNPLRVDTTNTNKRQKFGGPRPFFFIIFSAAERGGGPFFPAVSAIPSA
jgi:hypothetical protein